MVSKQYSISSPSRRWWWPSAAVGVAATAAIAAIVAVPAAVGHATPDRDSGTGSGASIMDTVAPVTNAGATDCPPPPDIRYVGVPWVPPEPTGCVSIDRWWTLVDAR